ncbi:MAG: LPS export ABC transporter permease LptG [Deltaproteobacteria bacterium]|nr:LPS export ABC transporter permease LptG [Deltaproteobacteria bacterium]
MSFANASSFRIIPLYLSREFLRTFCLCLLFLWTLALLIDFFDRLDDFIRQDASIFSVLRYFFFKAPLFVSQMAPAAALTGSLLSLSLLSRSRELLALKACGVSTVQIARPLLSVAGILSVAIWGWNEVIVPPAFHKARVINSEEIKKKPFKGFFDERGFWYHGERVFYHIEHFDLHDKSLSGLTIYQLDDQFQVRSLAEVSRAVWKDGKWNCENFQERSFSNVQPIAGQLCHSLLRETPDDFAIVALEAEEFSSQQLRQYILDLQRKGLDTTEYQVDLYLKGALPIATLTMTLLGLSLAVPGAKQLTLTTSLGLALVIGFSYWVLLALSVSLGHSGALSPFLSAWIANSATCLVGVFFLLGVD